MSNCNNEADLEASYKSAQGYSAKRAPNCSILIAKCEYFVIVKAYTVAQCAKINIKNTPSDSLNVLLSNGKAMSV